VGQDDTGDDDGSGKSKDYLINVHDESSSKLVHSQGAISPGYCARAAKGHRNRDQGGSYLAIAILAYINIIATGRDPAGAVTYGEARTLRHGGGDDRSRLAVQTAVLHGLAPASSVRNAPDQSSSRRKRGWRVAWDGFLGLRLRDEFQRASRRLCDCYPPVMP
jgi:hypothetical protein